MTLAHKQVRRPPDPTLKEDTAGKSGQFTSLWSSLQHSLGQVSLHNLSSSPRHRLDGTHLSSDGQGLVRFESVLFAAVTYLLL
jgi:hypothetical protein